MRCSCRRRGWFAATLLVTAVIAGCGGGEDSPGAGTSATAAQQEPEGTNQTDEASETGSDVTDAVDAGSGDTGSLIAPIDTVPSDSEDAAGSESELVPESGGTLRVAVEAESDGLNPAANSFALSAHVMADPVVEPLAYWDTAGRWTPYLAESFTDVGDGSQWQVRLREGVRFHDGSALDADDVIANFAAQMADPVISLAVRPNFPDSGAITKIDEYTVQFNLLEPYAHFPQALTTQLGMVVPAHYLQAALEDPSLNQTPVGTGPFMVESRIQDEVTVLARNQDYWAADFVDVYLDRIEVYPITDTAIAAERLLAGDIDIVITSNPEAILTLREGDNVGTIENSRGSENLLMLNTEIPPFDDIRARKAFTFATPKKAYIELLGQGVVESAESMFHPDLIWHNPELRQEADMGEQAGALVLEYCADHPENCSDGRINMEYQHPGPSVVSTRAADLLNDGLEDYFNVEIQEVLQDDHIIQVILGQYNAVIWRQFGAVDPGLDAVWLRCDSVGFISLNYPRYCDPERDELLFEERAIDDIERRAEIWNEIQQRIHDAYTYVFLDRVNWTIGVRDGVHNICGQTSPATGVELFCNNSGRIGLHQVWLS